MITNGHPGAADYSPEQCLAFADLIHDQKRDDILLDYTIATAAAHADKKSDKKFRDALKK